MTNEEQFELARTRLYYSTVMNKEVAKRARGESHNANVINACENVLKSTPKPKYRIYAGNGK